MTEFCRDCKHQVGTGMFPECARTEFFIMDYVKGTRKRYYLNCSGTRGVDAKCPEGFEPRQQEPSLIAKLKEAVKSW